MAERPGPGRGIGLSRSFIVEKDAMISLGVRTLVRPGYPCYAITWKAWSHVASEDQPTGLGYISAILILIVMRSVRLDPQTSVPRAHEGHARWQENIPARR